MTDQSLSPTSASPISLVFLGAGPLAAESLKFLYSKFTIESVITKAATSSKFTPPVVEFCQSNQIPYFTPSNKVELSQLVASQSFASRFGVVVDYGIIISSDVIQSFPLGIVNSHFSLLPQWRGADPITFAILSGQPKTGVSLMLIDERMDEGPVIAQSDLRLPKNITSPKLTELLLDLSNAMLAEVLPVFFRGQLQPIPQNQLPDAQPVSYSRKLTKQDGKLDFTKSAEELEREIRAFMEWPKSYTSIGDIPVIIEQAHAINTSHGQTGEIELQDSETLSINCSQGSLVIDKLKPAGKKTMTAAEFVRGYGPKIKKP